MADIDPRLLALIAPPEEGRHSGYDKIDGVVQHIHITFANYLKHTSEIHSLAPIRHLTLLGGDESDVRTLFGSPEMARLRSLEIRTAPVTDAELEILALSPHPAQLRWLCFYKGRATFAGLRTVAESLSLAQLVHLEPGSDSEDPRLVYYTDWDGSIASSHFPKSGELLERWYGPVPWLQPGGPDTPDRFKV